MNNSNDNTVRPELQDDIIELGMASVETKGLDGGGEPVGQETGIGMSED